ncbi:uncharacterized protein LOC135847098 [Planococcus citri]|uniref:uncharacterized protein LOC135847098 n=1 Tax=Planococcus citri TaxID=170843 RepID=UPI0031F8E496
MNFVVFISLLSTIVFSTVVLGFGIHDGVYEPFDRNSTLLQLLAKRALNKSDSDSGADCTRKVNQVISAKRSVSTDIASAAKWRFDLELEICPGTCASGVNNTTDGCKICNTDLTYFPVKDDFTLKSIKCPS